MSARIGQQGTALARKASRPAQDPSACLAINPAWRTAVIAPDGLLSRDDPIGAD
ncbi:MAG TPA: hypothetical protein PKV33_03710 [Methanothrix sp.]|nr:hypothetical protein [Methanothrix sp.]